MQYINLNKTLNFEEKITDLLLINIDDQVEINEDKEGIKIIGKIAISGNARTLGGDKPFSDHVDLDIFLTPEEIEQRNLLNVSVKDFDYKIDDKSLILNISLKVEGLKEIETIFLTQEDNEDIQEEIDEEEKEEIEVEEINKKVYIDVDIDVSDRNSENEDNKEEEVNNELAEETTVKEKKSLLKSVFSNRKISEEVCWKIHCVKGESSYEEIANIYKVDVNKLISINNNEKLCEGKLIFLPIE